MKSNSIYQLVLLLVISIFILSCSEKAEKYSSSSTNREAFKEVILDFTEGQIKAGDPIRIVFKDQIVAQEELDKAVPQKLLQFKPGLKGSLAWETRNTLRFIPTQLKYNQLFEATLDVRSLLEKGKSKEEQLHFEFQTTPLDYELIFQGLELKRQKDTKTSMELQGKFSFNAPIDTVVLKECLKVDYSVDEKPIISWKQNAATFDFTITGIKRDKKMQPLVVLFDGKKLGAEENYEKRFLIPAENEFKVLSAEVVPGNTREIEITFSGFPKKDQKVAGLIQLENVSMQPEFLLQDNKIRVIFRSELEGEHKLFISKKILDEKSNQLDKDFEKMLYYSSPKPALRLLGSGTICSDVNEVVLPFEAINLNAVDVEISKVYQNNMLQFLQYSDFSEEYFSSEVSEIIWQDKVDLGKLSSTNATGEWSQYGLDLMKFISIEPGALYNIKIAFRNDYSSFPCQDDNSSKFKEAGLGSLAPMENGEYKSIWKHWYYYSGRNWKDRDDPCLPMYYTSDHFVQQNILASNIGLIAKYDNRNNLFVSVLDLKTGQPRAAVDIKVYSYQQQLLGQAVSNSEGIINLEIGSKAYFIIAREGDEYAYLKMNDYQALSMSEFDIGGKELPIGIDGSIISERGVWRPGDTMYLHFVLRDPESTVPDDLPLKFELLDPQGNQYLEQISAQHSGPFYNFTCSTSADAVTGNWRANVYVGPKKFSKNLKIETVKPNRLKIDMDLPEEDLQLGVSSLDLLVNWLNGLPGSGLEVDVDLELRATRTMFPSYGSYVFDDVARQFDRLETTLFRDKLNEKGEVKIPFKLNENYQYPGKLKSLFKVRAYEKSGEYSSNSFSSLVSPYSSYVGLALPKSDWGRASVKLDTETQVPIIALDPEGKTLANRKLSVGIYQAQWRWWWDDSGNDIAQYNSDKHLMAFKKLNVISGQDGKVTVPLTVEDYGAYMIRVCDDESGHCTGDLFYAGYYGNSEDAKEFAAMLQLKVEKDKYDVGEKARITIPAGESSKVLISLESGGKIVKNEWITAEGDVMEYDFTIEENMFPNVYAHVTVVQGLEERVNDLPIRQYGVINIDVEDEKFILLPKVTTPDVIKPNGDYKLSVSEENGKEMFYTLAVVDEGLLDLTRFKTPELYDDFYARRASLTKSWDNFEELLGTKAGLFDRIISIGGDENVEINNNAETANRFVPVVEFLGPFHLPAGKKLKHELQMSNYSGAVRVMLVGASDDSYGSFEKSVKVKDDLMALLTAPRVLSPGETIDIPVTVFVTEPGIKQVELTIANAENLKSVGDNSLLLDFDQPGEKIGYFSFKAAENESIAKLSIKAKSKKAIASQDLEIQISNPNTYHKKSADMVLAPGESATLDIPIIGVEGSNSATIEFSKLPSLGIEERVRELIRYPYGCIEQTTSSVFPQLYLSELMDLSQDRKNKIKLNIIQGISRLKSFQLQDNSMSYWPGDSGRSEWGSIYAAHFLTEAKSKGYNTSSVLPKLLSYLKQSARSFRVKSKKENDYRLVQQAYKTMVLSKAGKPEFGAMNYLFKIQGLSPLAKWYLSLAYSFAGQKDVAAQLLKGENIIQPYASNSYHYGSQLRDYSVLLYAYDQAAMRNKAAKLLNEIVKIYKQKNYWSTQTLANLLASIGEREKESDGIISFEYENRGKSDKISSSKTAYALVLGEEEFSGEKIQVKNTGDGELFVNYSTIGKPRMGDEGSADVKNLDFSLTYVDELGNPLDISNLKMGTEFKAIATINKKGLLRNIDEMVLNQIFPSGWEILNWRMDGGTTNNSELDYQDIRDDRVYSFFDLKRDKIKIEIPLHASYAGNFYLPQTFVEAMYDDDVYANKEGKWVEVVRD